MLFGITNVLIDVNAAQSKLVLLENFNENYSKCLRLLVKLQIAWYETLSTYLLDNEFQRGKIDKTLFIKRYKGDILLVQVYADDIIFGSTKKELCNAFEKLMHEKFQMSSIGELTFFLGLQVQQKKDDIFISQDKYVAEILKKFGFTEVKTASTPIETQKPLLKDEDGEEVDVHMYRSMIGSLMYLTSSRPDIMFVVCVCARYQVNPKVSHLYAVKMIFRYLKGQPKLGIWSPKDSPFDLVAYTDSDYAGASLDRKSTTREKAKKSVRLMMEKLVIRENRQKVLVRKRIERIGENKNRKRAVWNKNRHRVLVRKRIERIGENKNKKRVVWNKNKQSDLVSKRIKRSGKLKNRKRVEYIENRQSVWNGIKVNAGDSKLMLLGINLILLLGITYYCWAKVNAVEEQFWSTVNGEVQLHALVDGKKIIITESTVRRDLQIEDAEGVDYEAVYKELNDSLVRAATTASSLKAEQDSGNIAKTQSKATPNESSSLGTTSGGGPRRQETIGDTIAQTRFENVSKHSNDPLLARARVESSRDKESLGEDASKQGRINAIDADEDITLVNDQDDADMFDVNTLTALAALKSVKPKVKANVVEEPSVPVSAASTKVSAATTTTTATIPTPRKGIVITELGTSTTTTISSQPSQAKVQDKGKGIMVEPEKPLKKKDQISFDEQEAIRLQAEFDEEERLAREKDEANVALTEEWDDIQAKVDADYQLAQRLQAEEQEQFTTEQKATLFKELLEQRRKHFAAKRAEEKRNKPPTKTQQKKTMITYLKNMEGWKHKDLKSKDFDSIKELFDKAFKRVNMFVDYRTDLVEGSSKRAGDELEQEVTKKQKVDDVQETAKVDDDQEAAKIKELMEIVPDEEEVAIDAIPLATKPPTIVDWKIHKEGKKNYYQIIRADGSSKMYLVFSHMLKSFDREDFETLWKLVKAKYGSTRLVEDLDLILWGDLKTMFEPHVEDRVWRNQQDYRVLDWKLYDSCGVHSLRMQHMHIHMLVEKRYPLTPATITDMLNKKLQLHISAAQRLRRKTAAEGVNAASKEVSTAELVRIQSIEVLKWDQQVVSELVALRNFAKRYGSRFCTHGGCILSSHAQTE
ncbi:putative ribonuclease H-like domain-containing protein [Tanacetum coccineum]